MILPKSQPLFCCHASEQVLEDGSYAPDEEPPSPISMTILLPCCTWPLIDKRHNLPSHIQSGSAKTRSLDHKSQNYS
jgi:hypothetical protein